MSTDEARDVVRRYLDAAFVRKEFEDVDALVANPGLKSAAQGFVAAFPDLEMRFEHATGTHKGEFRGYPATDKRWQATASAWYQVADGRIVNAWINWDWLSIMEAIGAVSWNEEAKNAVDAVKGHP
jgi:predicted ester cyclase